jgi:soluble lytic murein transglycosylase-like protein
MNAADNLVALFPDTVSQLRDPVYRYFAKGLPYTGKDQDLYLMVFRPADRKAFPFTPFPAKVIVQNPGIFTPQDYVNKINAAKPPRHGATVQAELEKLASKLKVPVTSLDKLIMFESGWKPLAKNPYSGARGLIQFIPSTAASFGYPAYKPVPADATTVKPSDMTTPPNLASGETKRSWILPTIIVAGVLYYVWTKNKGTITRAIETVTA